MHEHARFFGAFLRDPKGISSIIPTSKKNVKKICSDIEADKDVVVVEYGPGTGGVAKHLLGGQRLTRQSLLILIERNPMLAEELQNMFRDTRVRIFNDSAQNVRSILQRCDVEHADHVLTSIPLSVMTPSVRGAILQETYAALKPGGHLTVFLFRKIVKKYLTPVFGPVDIERLLLNIPPLWIFRATKAKSA